MFTVSFAFWVSWHCEFVGKPQAIALRHYSDCTTLLGLLPDSLRPFNISSPSLSHASVMDRTDSAFDEAFRLERPQVPPIHRSNTDPARQRKSKKSHSNPACVTEVTTMRPASEKRTTNQRRPAEPRRKSIASSSGNSTTKSRRRNHGSLPSSRRTSCTVVDPSRPARQYRIKSSQTVPTMTGDIDDVLALHFRSCSIFQKSSYHQSGGLPSPLLSEHAVDAPEVREDAIVTDFGTVRQHPVAAPTTDDFASPMETEVEDEMAIGLPDTTMHWISPGTRRDQYRKIDKDNKGLRGLARRVLPRCVSGPPSQQFYQVDKSDVGSVRRYRMDLDEEEDDEKDALRKQSRKLERTTKDKDEKKTKWCLRGWFG